MSLTMIGDVKIPIIGLGTWQSLDESELTIALNTALEIGYRHIDTAALYNNEHIIGKVLEEWLTSGRIRRENIFITTKLCFYDNDPDLVESRLRESLAKLRLDYVDLYLLHFPIYMKEGECGQPTQLLPTDLIGLWKKMEEQVDAKRTRTIGVSNFSIEQIERIMLNSRIKPANTQVELHIYYQQKELREYCKKNNIIVVSFATLGSPNTPQFFEKMGRKINSGEFIVPSILADPVVTKLAQKYKKTTAQIVLRYFTQNNVVVIPKSVKPERIRENFNIFDFKLDAEDLKTLESLDKGEDGIIFFWTIYSAEIIHHPEFPYKNTKRCLKMSSTGI